ncbi:class I SAM-dependent DNA methyltransferase [Sulfurirhabdus autotrophica]|uniref:site-specific DNA-methyltransferase (adenine-specific) n=1 Tax=Sulfurirhabdus autotrophica TaxID=1706046 RepID=A0A4R3XU45_9PROT|nr:DNA methyltransferase [Sulfurirhabdus autotrophica]TCV80218.1 type II restriction/modification system DNA methylase subunit YeeA [Sulfurirhabdus autotrophica]
MTPQAFIEKWKDNPLKERASYQLHFIDLCALLGVPTPSPSSHESYCFERGATRTGAGQGWADVWKQGFFAFEYKATRRNLGEALKQLMTYALALDNPPLLVVCDTNIIEIHTHFTNAPSEVHTISLENINQPENLTKLHWLFETPDKFHPGRTIAQITEEAAGKFADLAQSLNTRGHSPQQVAHFLNQCLFCLFAEDAGLLPEKLFERLLDKSRTDPAKLTTRLKELFAAMRKGGDFALEDINWFNGGLFENVAVLPLTIPEIKILHAAANLDWSGIEPSIFGTLFERGLDPKKRSQLGAHYTDPQSIQRIIDPVIVEPLSAEWHSAKTQISKHMALYQKGGKGSQKALQEASALFHSHLERLKNFRVLDPACGSGNFLYLALRTLKDLEHKANLEAEVLGLQRQAFIEVSPENVLGIELNPYAAELARVTVWIGEIQWMLKNGYPIRKNPILQPLDHIENRDAVMELILGSDITVHDEDGNIVGTEGESSACAEAVWPAANAIIGNPPFLGGSKMRGELGDGYIEALRMLYKGRVPGGADLVTYWFEKARAQIEIGKCDRTGLVTTQAIRKGSNQKVLARICDTTRIFNAWSDEEWINEGAAVRVSLVCFGQGNGVILDGKPVEAIHADLTSGSGLDLTQANQLNENTNTTFEGTKKYGAFDIPGELARQWLKQPNPNGKPNSDVVRPWANGMDIARRSSDTWIIDFGTDMTEVDAALYETPFTYVLTHVKPYRETVNRERTRRNWWIHEEARISMRKALKGLTRFIVTPRVAKHRIFVWLPIVVLPDTRLNVISRSDDTAFGILHSRFHEAWALAQVSIHGDGGTPTYNAKSCFETFPFPTGLTPNLVPSDYANPSAAEIAEAAQQLNTLRENWLNPVEWTERVPEVVAGYPDRIIAKTGFEAELKKRTLTNLYNARPAWLDNVHKTLDRAVAHAYGWNDYTPDMPDEEILRRLLVLNLERS